MLHGDLFMLARSASAVRPGAARLGAGAARLGAARLGAVRPGALALAPSRLDSRDSSSRAAAKMGALSVDPMGSNPTMQSAEYVMTQFDRLANWARKSSMWPMTFGLA